MGKFFKKNWFICLLVVLFAGISIYYIYDTNKGKLKGKQSDGQDVVYEINGEDETASQFYDDMYKTNGVSAVYHAFNRAVVEQAVDTTDDMKTTAQSQASSVISNYMQNYPSNYREQLDSQLKSLGYDGYDDLEDYLINYQKTLKVASDYAKDHFDELKIRNVSYILIQFENSSAVHNGQPTVDEQNRMDAVDKELAAGKDFAQVAANHSEDTSTASKGGVLGTIDKNVSNLDENFLAAALELNEGEVSNWVYSEQFGYFKIKVNAATPETLQTVANQQANASEYTAEPSATTSPSASMEPEASPAASAAPSASASAEASPSASAEPVEADPYSDLVSSYDSQLIPVSLWAKAQELGITFSDDSVKEGLLNYLGLNEDGTLQSQASASPEASASAEPSASPSAESSASASAESSASASAESTVEPSASAEAD